jgi:hypothetical protein
MLRALVFLVLLCAAGSSIGVDAVGSEAVSNASRVGVHTGLQPLTVAKRVVAGKGLRLLMSQHHLSKAHMLFSFSRGYFLCLMPKVGCSNWLDFIKTNHGLKTGKINTYKDASDPTADLFFLADQDPADRLMKRRFRAFILSPQTFRAAVVRHPWNRLISGFRDKARGANPFPPPPP